MIQNSHLSNDRAVRLGVSAATASLIGIFVGCSSPRPPPVVFAESAAYRTLKKNVAGFEETDVDQDGYPDGWVFVRDGELFAPAWFRQDPQEEGVRWVRECKGQGLSGEELEPLRWIGDVSDRHLLAAATSEDPDRLRVSFAVYAPEQPCEPIFSDERVFEKARGEVLAPDSLRLGLQNEPALVIVEEPTTTQLRGEYGTVELVTAVNVRRWNGVSSDTAWSVERRGLLRRLAFDVQWFRRPDETPDAIVGEGIVTLEESASTTGVATSSTPTAAPTPGVPSRFDPKRIRDRELSDAWVLRRGEPGTLEIRSETPVVLVKLRHGCALNGEGSLEISGESGPSLFVTGSSPVANSPIQASASGRAKHGQPAVELLALAKPSRTVSLQLGPSDQERCLRAISVYGWRDGLTASGSGATADPTPPRASEP